MVGRIVADALSARLGVSVVVENQSGASGAIAAATVARAPPDGHTILLGGNAIFAILPHVTKVNYDGVKDFTAIANLSESLRVLAVSPAVPAKTLPEFVDHARRVSGKLNFGSAGIGSTLHLMTEIFQREAGFEAVHVPFRGSTPAVQALLRGDIDFLIDTVVIPYVEQGTLRGLAAVSDRRLPTLPDLPTLVELGYPNVRTSGWQALLGPANLAARGGRDAKSSPRGDFQRQRIPRPARQGRRLAALSAVLGPRPGLARGQRLFRRDHSPLQNRGTMTTGGLRPGTPSGFAAPRICVILAATPGHMRSTRA